MEPASTGITLSVGIVGFGGPLQARFAELTFCCGWKIVSDWFRRVVEDKMIRLFTVTYTIVTRGPDGIRDS